MSGWGVRLPCASPVEEVLLTVMHHSVTAYVTAFTHATLKDNNKFLPHCLGEIAKNLVETLVSWRVEGVGFH